MAHFDGSALQFLYIIIIVILYIFFFYYYIPSTLTSTHKTTKLNFQDEIKKIVIIVLILQLETNSHGCLHVGYLSWVQL